MNDKLRAAGTAIKQPSLAEIIVNSLNEITDGSTGVANELGELERYLYGDRPMDKSAGVSENPSVESWENDVLRKLDHIKEIISEQHNTLSVISKFHK
jgi:hypothetical protein